MSTTTITGNSGLYARHQKLKARKLCGFTWTSRSAAPGHVHSCAVFAGHARKVHSCRCGCACARNQKGKVDHL